MAKNDGRVGRGRAELLQVEDHSKTMGLSVLNKRQIWYGSCAGHPSSAPLESPSTHFHLLMTQGLTDCGPINWLPCPPASSRLQPRRHGEEMKGRRLRLGLYWSIYCLDGRSSTCWVTFSQRSVCLSFPWSKHWGMETISYCVYSPFMNFPWITQFELPNVSCQPLDWYISWISNTINVSVGEG